MAPSRTSLLRGVAGTAISVAALLLALRQVDVAQAAAVIGAAAPTWLAFMVACQVLDVTVRARRWQRLIAPIGRVAYRPMLGYMLIGYLANNVLPARLGELVRSHYLGDREAISRTTTLGTVVVERVVDTGVLVLVALGAILVLSTRGLVADAVLVGLAVSGLLVVGLALGIAAHRLPGAGRAAAMLARWPRLLELAARLRGGLAVAGRPRTIGEVVALSALAWGTTILAFAAAGQSIGVELTTAQAALLAAGVALVTAIPSGPGYLGTFELAAIAIAATFGVGRDEAFALAFIVHASILVLTSLGGAVALARLGWARVPRSSGADGAREGAFGG